MKLGVFTALFGGRSLEEALDYIVESGLEAVEIGTGNYPGNPHCPLNALLASKRKRDEWKAKITDRGLVISALSCHGNPLHPNRRIAAQHDKVFRDTIRLARRLGVRVVINFSGCPGDKDGAKYPNWVVCPWPPHFTELINWQWEKKVIPYWKAAARLARNNGIKVGIEMHPGFVVHSTETMMRLRDAAGKNIGANFDPSHLFWQGIDPIASLRFLGDAVFHVHAKDCAIYAPVKLTGVLDTKPYADEIHRSWIFRTVGYGHGYDFWKDFVSTLRLIGYDGVISIEHEDSLMSVNEGFQKAVEFLEDVLLREKPGEMWWA